MFDCHCDLLTFIYINRDNIEKIKNTYNKIYNSKNITGAIFNLYFMSEKEMEDELNIKKEELNVIDMLKTVNKIIKENNIFNKNIKYIYGIEGLDYLEKISDIDILYDLGLRSTNIVWNNKNKYGAGSKIDNKYGLTNEGEELVEKLIQKNILIDLSHSNEKTFFDIIEKVKQMRKKGYNPKVFASHSNLKSICNVERNLSDKQALAIKSLNGVIGIVEYKKFISLNTENFEEEYLKHINYLIRLFGGIENIAVSTDDEIFYNKKIQNSNLYSSEKVGENIKKLLLDNNYTLEEVKNITENNIKRFI